MGLISTGEAQPRASKQARKEGKQSKQTKGRQRPSKASKVVYQKQLKGAFEQGPSFGGKLLRTPSPPPSIASINPCSIPKMSSLPYSWNSLQLIAWPSPCVWMINAASLGVNSMPCHPGMRQPPSLDRHYPTLRKHNSRNVCSSKRCPSLLARNCARAVLPKLRVLACLLGVREGEAMIVANDAAVVAGRVSS